MCLGRVNYPFLLSVTLLVTSEAQSVEPTTKLSHGGSVQGSEVAVDNVKVEQYLGIPFAKPPMGPLRFQLPEKVEPWSGTIDAKKRPNTCWQYLLSGFDVTNKGALIWANNTEMSEDCLYLNVWVPLEAKAKGEKLPVMVWIFGGGFFSGSSTLDVYDGSFLAAKENVIIVSMQYRIGPFGFLYVEGLVKGNMGLKDQQLSLKWVQENIEAFGGDKSRVTIFGESAGAVSVGLQYLAPSSRGLFQRIIMQSSSPFNRWALSTKASAHESGISFIKACNCSNKERDRMKEIECLRSLPADSIFDYLYMLTTASTARRQQHLENMSPKPQWPVPFLTDAGQYFDVYMRPVIDGDFIPDCPATILKSITGEDAPQALLGSVDREGMYWLFYGLGLKGVQFLHANGSVTLPSTEKLRSLKIDYQQLIQTRFMSTGYLVNPLPSFATLNYAFNSPEILASLSYNSDIPMNRIDSATDFLKRMDELSADMDFVCGTLLFARLLSNIPNSKVQYYNFMYKTESSPFPNAVGAMHGYEIEYIFGMPYSEQFKQFYTFTETEKNLSDRIMRYWTNFAKYGDATYDLKGIDVQTLWPYFNATAQQYLEIDLKTSIVKANLKNRGCTFWNDIFPSLAKVQALKSGYPRHATPQICPHMETELYPVQRLRNYLDGVYYDAGPKFALTVTPMIILPLLIANLHQ